MNWPLVVSVEATYTEVIAAAALAVCGCRCTIDPPAQVTALTVVEVTAELASVTLPVAFVRPEAS